MSHAYAFTLLHRFPKGSAGTKAHMPALCCATAQSLHVCGDARFSNSKVEKPYCSYIRQMHVTCLCICTTTTPIRSQPSTDTEPSYAHIHTHTLEQSCMTHMQPRLHYFGLNSFKVTQSTHRQTCNLYFLVCYSALIRQTLQTVHRRTTAEVQADMNAAMDSIDG